MWGHVMMSQQEEDDILQAPQNCITGVHKIPFGVKIRCDNSLTPHGLAEFS